MKYNSSKVTQIIFLFFIKWITRCHENTLLHNLVKGMIILNSVLNILSIKTKMRHNFWGSLSLNLMILTIHQRKPLGCSVGEGTSITDPHTPSKPEARGLHEKFLMASIFTTAPGMCSQLGSPGRQRLWAAFCVPEVTYISYIRSISSYIH